MKSPNATFEQVQHAVSVGRYFITGHGSDEMDDDDLSEAEVIAATLTGEVIEDYPMAFPHPACLVLGRLNDDSAVHLVWAIDAQKGYAAIVTAYRPDPARWSADLKTRVKQP